MRGRRSPVLARKLRAVLRTPAGNDPDIELTTEYLHPLLTEAAWVSSWDATGSVLETEADHA
jgi:hypothetical protein